MMTNNKRVRSNCIGYPGHKCGTRVKSIRRKRCPKCTKAWQLIVTRRWDKEHPEHITVARHWYYIFKSRRKDARTYKGMPFFDGWNPDKGGSFQAGADWIIANLGRRPKGHTMHIVDHEKGFWPTNLEWASLRRQSAKQMFKIIADLRHLIRELEDLAENPEASVV